MNLKLDGQIPQKIQDFVVEARVQERKRQREVVASLPFVSVKVQVLIDGMEVDGLVIESSQNSTAYELLDASEVSYELPTLKLSSLKPKIDQNQLKSEWENIFHVINLHS